MNRRPDHALRRLERITIPPGNETVDACEFWPECQCDGDCTDRRALTPEQCILLLVLFCLLFSGLGLLWLAVR